MKFGKDDESPLNQLLDELDIQSAINRLTRVGFKVLFSSNERHHLSRPRGEGQEDIFIRVDEHNHFVVQHANNGNLSAVNDIITSWDEWVVFVRLLVLKATPPKCEEPESNEKKT